MRRIIGFIAFLVLICSVRGQTYSYRYWFDNTLSTLQTGSANGEMAIEIDISALTVKSVHAMHLQGLDSRNQWSPVRTTYFFLAKESDMESVTARYWYDNDETTAQMAPTVNGLINLDISHMDIGIHAVHYQTFNDRGEASPVQTEYFFLTQESDTESVSARYWYDNDETTVQTAPTVNGLIDLDISHMDIGIHAVHYQTFNDRGEASPVQTEYFYMNELQYALLSCKVWIDDKEDEVQTFGLTDDDIVIEAEDLSVGTHALHVILFDSNGQWLAEGAAIFEVKEPTVIITLNSLIETFSSVKDLDFSGVSGLRAYTATGFHRLDGDVMMTRVDDVPAGEGLLLMGEPGTYEVPVRKSHSYYANLLVATSEPTVIAQTSGGYVNYLLLFKDGFAGFFLAEEGSILGAEKAYLHIPCEKVSDVRRLKMRFDDNPDVVDIISRETSEDGAIYDLNGRKLSAPHKGINIIRMNDGTTRKVMIK